MRGRAVPVALAACLAALGPGAGEAAACSCVYTSAETFERADAAVTARLIEIGPEADFRYRVGRVYKGPRRLRSGRVIAIRHPVNTSCALSSETGRLRGLFLWREEGRWTSDSCGETTPRKMRRAARGRAPRRAGAC